MSEINIESLFKGNSSLILIVLVVLFLTQSGGKGCKPGFKDPLSSILPIILILILFSSGGKGGKGCKF